MPDIKIYVPDEMYYKLKKTPNRSKLIQDLLTEYWHSENEHRKKKKKELVKSKIGRESGAQTPIKKVHTPDLIISNVRGL